MDSDVTLAHFLCEPILATHHTHEELEQFLLNRISPFQLPNPETWETESEQIRQRVLDEVIFRGVPDAWRHMKPEVVWSDVLETGQGYRIRKLRYLALPGLWIPALLYEPETLPDRAPAVLNVNGHEQAGKAVDYKQLRCINLAKRGVLSLNPEWLYFGQLRTTGYEHNRSGYIDLCGVAGVAVFYLAMMRGLDVLLGHDHTDSDRVAVTGLSGGGWQTIILSSLDTRVRLAVPNAGYIGLDMRVKNRGDIGDIEQNPADLATIADYPVLTAMMAPRPTLLLYNQVDDCCFRTERSVPSIYEPVLPLYEALGQGDAFLYHNNVDPGTHNYDMDNRQQFYRFLNRHFISSDTRIDDEIPSNDEICSQEDLMVDIPPGNADFITLAETFAHSLPRTSWPQGDGEAIKAWQQEGRHRLREVLRYQPLEVTTSRPSGERWESGYQIARYTLHLGDEWTLPVIDVSKPETGQNVLVVTSDFGCQTTAPVVNDALNQGKRVIVVDILLHGDCKTKAIPSHQFAMMASAAGSRLLGVQMAQLAAAIRWAADHTGTEGMTVTGVGPVSSVVALGAAALADTRLNRVVTIEGFASLKQLIESQTPYEDCPSLFCFGLLEAFDIRELIGLLAPLPVDILDPQADRSRLVAEWEPLCDLYAQLGYRGYQPWEDA